LHVKSRLARFIGVDAYEAAGGIVHRDLFGDDAWIEDRELAERLALEKLEKRAAKERKKGWGWVEVSIDDPGANKLKRVYEQSPTQMPWLGVFVTIDRGGNGTRLEGPFERPGDRQRVEQGKPVPASAEEAKAIKAPPKEDLSLAQIMRLKGVRTEIARCMLVRNPQFMLTALAASLAAEVFHDGSLGSSPVKLQPGARNNIPDFRAGREWQQQVDDFGAGVDALRWSDLLASMHSTDDVQEWLLQQPDAVTRELLAFCATQLIELDDTADDTAFLARAGLNLAECWQPTGEWLATLPKAVVLRIVREVHGTDAATALESLKKDELTVEAAKLLANTGYLPEPLRTPDYKPTLGLAQESIKKKSRTKSTAPKSKKSPAKAAKKAAKKPAKKAPAGKAKGRAK
jgi:ParB family chromosome partitioning protein